MSVFLLQGIIPTEFKRVKTNDILVEGAHIDEFNGIYSLSPIPTVNGAPDVANGTNNYLHTTNAGYRFYCNSNWFWHLANNVPSPVDGNWNPNNADAYYRFAGHPSHLFPPNASYPGVSLDFWARGRSSTTVIPHSPGRVEVIRSRNTRFNGVYDEAGMYNGQVYYRRGDSSYGIIFADKAAWIPEDPEDGSWFMNSWAIVDDLPLAPFTQYYFMQTYDSTATNGWYTTTSFQTSENLYDDYLSHWGDAYDLSIVITEIDLG